MQNAFRRVLNVISPWLIKEVKIYDKNNVVDVYIVL